MDYYNLKLEKSVASYDIPHAFKAYVNYELPVGRGKALLGSAPRLVNAVLLAAGRFRNRELLLGHAARTLYRADAALGRMERRQ